jgi:hypothetical protein
MLSVQHAYATKNIDLVYITMQMSVVIKATSNPPQIIKCGNVTEKCKEILLSGKV